MVDERGDCPARGHAEHRNGERDKNTVRKSRMKQAEAKQPGYS